MCKYFSLESQDVRIYFHYLYLTFLLSAVTLHLVFHIVLLYSMISSVNFGLVVVFAIELDDVTGVRDQGFSGLEILKLKNNL